MRKNYLFLFLSLLLTNTLLAQEEAPATVVKNQFKINMLYPGFVYEHGFSDKNTLYSEVNLGLGYRYNSYYDESTVYFFPSINEQFRHYYNFAKRAAKGKRTAHNSANFVALSAYYNFKSIATNEKYGEYSPSFTIAPLWGFQRTYKRKFNLEVHLGAGINVDKFDTEFTPIGNLTLGWVIGK
ncbi:MAG: hypothetical protein ABIP27_11285 [Flavobacterium circumlabens]|uniref:DUF3575 domain-containing protein n=1 Tax=Flavobacterium circumlabens TaxID=2133765 RepID=A0A4Y7UDE5_9FLAO|nr:hypothetical protein [Flavobacterium circumlabens]TCN59089.1 hypothetical protein EV142_103540 [Flavobacterium circumlabens]TEB44480.1 hypothetical protein D0809_12105 [Flavobacterium circumlabens]